MMTPLVESDKHKILFIYEQHAVFIAAV